MRAKKSTSQQSIATEPRAIPGQWEPKVAYAAANMAGEVASRLISVLVLLDHVESPSPDYGDDHGYTLGTIRELVLSYFGGTPPGI